ncbi:MAG: D-glycero-beta-D-manno-heptose 1-phosphate adenylyltransferase [Fusobacteriaceae bacterium]|jgi:glycerol-3-phosphate cytidylyltransferase|nr:D-glycero-beta-D-manno-heptose 1-phosphate adenylyltransferase [Fusobacteriaceae bacterium]
MVLTKEDAARILADEKKAGKKIVFTNGVFDILHIGHLRYLQEAGKLGDILVVGVNSDSSVKALKGSDRPVNGENERAELLAGLKPVDYTVIFAEQTPVALLETLKPHIHVKGGDYRKEDLPETAVVEKNGGEVRILSFVPGKSTTGILKKIKGA